MATDSVHYWGGGPPRPATARDNRTKRPWAEALKSKTQSTYLFDYYPKPTVTKDERESMVKLLDMLGNRQFDCVGRDDMAFSKYSFHDAEVMFESMDRDNSGRCFSSWRSKSQKLKQSRFSRCWMQIAAVRW